MKIVVISDTHGENKEIIKKLSEMEKPDLLFHLGDYVGDGMEISTALGIESLIVKGNGDFFNRDYNDSELIEVAGKKIFLTHGHLYGVYNGIQNLYYKGLELKVDIILFGHTHIPIIENVDDMIIMNPGSPSFPRTVGKARTFGMLEIEEEIKAKIIQIK